MPEPEGRMAASEGTEKLRAVKKKKKHSNTKVFIFKLERNSVSVTTLGRWDGNLIT